MFLDTSTADICRCAELPTVAPTVRIRIGDCRAQLANLAAQSVHCVVTSPPFFQLRQYLPDDHPDKALEIGRESELSVYIDTLVAVFRAVRRVLRDDGSVWLNLGDAYAARADPRLGIKPKDLMAVPFRVALALQADGWFLRQDIVWEKPNPRPQSVRDRCTTAHEYVFLLTKRPTYAYDADAIREPHASAYSRDAIAKAGGVIGGPRPAGDNFSKAMRHATGARTPRTRAERAALLNPLGRNRRSVWTVSPESSMRAAHFAPMPVALITPCVLAGCPSDGVVLDPFGGAGSTAIAAVQAGRNALLIELDAAYGAIAAARIAAATGVTASFDQQNAGAVRTPPAAS